MKITAFYIMMLFTMAQALPAIQSLWNENKVVLFDVNEENKVDSDENKLSKECISINKSTFRPAFYFHQHFNSAVNIISAPNYEKHTPPPDFS